MAKIVLNGAVGAHNESAGFEVTEPTALSVDSLELAGAENADALFAVFTSLAIVNNTPIGAAKRPHGKGAIQVTSLFTDKKGTGDPIYNQLLQQVLLGKNKLRLRAIRRHFIVLEGSSSLFLKTPRIARPDPPFPDEGMGDDLPAILSVGDTASRVRTSDQGFFDTILHTSLTVLDETNDIISDPRIMEMKNSGAFYTKDDPTLQLMGTLSQVRSTDGLILLADVVAYETTANGTDQKMTGHFAATNIQLYHA